MEEARDQRAHVLSLAERVGGLRLDQALQLATLVEELAEVPERNLHHADEHRRRLEFELTLLLLDARGERSLDVRLLAAGTP